MAVTTVAYEKMVQFAENVIDDWENKLEALNINRSFRLSDSLYQHVHKHANGNPRLMEFTFLYYGRMVDYGVGRGVTLEDRDSMMLTGETKRKRKMWYTEVFYRQLNRMAAFIQKETGNEIARLFVINGSDFIDNTTGEAIGRGNRSGSKKTPQTVAYNVKKNRR